jgi:uncharacterized damage-inducible protein DinB
MSSLRVATVLSLALAVSTPALAADAGTPAAPVAPPSFRSDYLKAIGRAEQQIVALEQAMPQGKFNWRPAKGVRSVAEVYLHIAGGIYFLVGQTGHAMPPEVKAIPPEKWESQTTKKDEIKTILTNAFAFLRTSLGEESDADLDKLVPFAGSEWSHRLFFMGTMAHCWEHLGQSIAYARSNGVVPPWSKPKDKE